MFRITGFRMGVALMLAIIGLMSSVVIPATFAPKTISFAAMAQEQTTAPEAPVIDPTKGPVTNLPLPRFVTLKTGEGNARRGPGLNHRIDWVFTQAGMPLLLTAEYENWRRVEDADGFGGWVSYALLSGVRSVLVTQDMAEFRSQPANATEVLYQTELGVIGRLLECNPDWCRINVDGNKGWVLKTAIWGVMPDEIIE